MPFKCSIFFQQQSTLLGGWSMNFWNGSSQVDFTKNATIKLRDTLGPCTGAQVWTPRGRISESEVFRNVFLIEFPGSAPTPVSATFPDADYPNTALLIKFRAAGNYSTQQWMRGIPDNIVDNSGRYTPTAQFKGRLNKFFAELTNGTNTWSLRVLNRATPKKVIQAITQQGVVTCVGHGYADQVKVRIKGVKGLIQANGVWRITRIDDNNFSLNFWNQPTTPVPVFGNPTATLQSYVFVQISNCEVVRASSHSTGRPTGLLGGRRRRRRTTSA